MPHNASLYSTEISANALSWISSLLAKIKLAASLNLFLSGSVSLKFNEGYKDLTKPTASSAIKSVLRAICSAESK